MLVLHYYCSLANDQPEFWAKYWVTTTPDGEVLDMQLDLYDSHDENLTTTKIYDFLLPPEEADFASLEEIEGFLTLEFDDGKALSLSANFDSNQNAFNVRIHDEQQTTQLF